MRRRDFPSRLKIVGAVAALFLLLAGGEPAASAPGAQGRSFEPGDVLVALGPGQVQWYDANGHFISTLTSAFNGITGGMAIDPSGKYLYVTTIDQNNISRFGMTGGFIDHFGSGYDSGLVSITFDRNGNALAGEYGGTGNILEFDAVGTLVSQYRVSPENAPVWLDIAFDQATVYFTTGGRVVYRFDRYSSYISPEVFAALSADSSSGANALRLLPPGDGSGGLLLADMANVKQLDANGNVVFTYDAPGEDSWQALSLAPDGKSFWAASKTWVYHFNIRNDQYLARFNAGNDAQNLNQTSRIWGVMVVGEWVAGHPASPPVVPTTVTPSYTPTNTTTPTDTPTEPEAPPIITPSDTFPPPPPPPPITTEGPTRPPEQPATPIPAPPRPTSVPPPPPGPSSDILIDILIFIAVVGAGAGAWLIRRAVKSSPRTKGKAGYRQTRVKMQIHEDAGSQVVEAASDKSMPQIRLRSGQGRVDYSIEPDDPNRDRGGQP